MLLKIPLGPWDFARQIRRLSMYTHSRLQSTSNDWRDIYVLNSICAPTDLDENNHMNNARYLREADMGRQNMWFHNGITDAMYKRKQTAAAGTRLGFVLASSTISKTFYVEQIFTSKDSSGKTIIHAYMVGCQQPVGITPKELMQDIGYVGPSPALPEHVQLWQKSEAISRSSIPKNDQQLQDWLKKYGGYASNVQAPSKDSNKTQDNKSSTDPTQYHSQLAVVTTGTERLGGKPAQHNETAGNNATTSTPAQPTIKSRSSSRVSETAEEFDTDDATPANADEANIEAELNFRSSL